jgi:hypothetical protein
MVLADADRNQIHGKICRNGPDGNRSSSNYTVWFEAGRTDFLKNAGVSNSSIEAKGVLLPLYEMSCKYKKPGKI